MDYSKIVLENIDLMRSKHPLVHNITNFVVMNSSANILLAQGAYPVMAHSIHEVADMVAIADALVLNIGTLTNEWVESMILAGKRANELNKPIVFDPVGSGATPLRTRKSREILDNVKVTVLRGNASEIASLMDEKITTRGVDSTVDVDYIVDSAKALARSRKLIVAVSGVEDLVTDGIKAIRIANGVPQMSMVTGLGCGLSATVGAFLGACPDPFDATVSAMSFFGIAGEKALEKTNLPGSFATAFIDSLYEVSQGTFRIPKIRIQG